MEVRSSWGLLLLLSIISIQPLLTETEESKLPPMQILGQNSQTRDSKHQSEQIEIEYDQPSVLSSSFKINSYSDRALLKRKLTKDENNEEQYFTEDNCTNPRDPPAEYNNSCNFVRKECGNKAEIFDYLEFMLCDMRKVQPLGYIILGLWLIYLISLLATTVDNYFFPPLIFLAEKLRLSPSIAGVTLLALGNGAPDIFVVFSGLAQDDLALVLGALSGGGIFITTVVLGTVILVTKVWPYKIDKVDFVRDVIAFMVVVGTVIAVAFDGVVYLLEACLFPLIYILYIALVIAIGYARKWWDKKKQQHKNTKSAEEEVIIIEDNGKNAATTKAVLDNSLPTNHASKMSKADASKVSEEDETKPLTEETNSETEEKPTICLHGLSWPKGSHFVIKILWLVQWPFSLLRWITIPPFSYKGCWSRWHYLFAVCSPIPMALLLLLSIKGPAGFTIFVGRMPLPALLALIGLMLTVLLMLTLRPKRPPHWSMQLVLVSLAFLMSIVWLNLEANEVVSVLKVLGLLLNIDTGILGLTILAFGNCVADWVADTMVARSGKPEMAVASCFGSPLLSHVVGLSIAMIVKIGINNRGAPYHFHIHTSEFAEVKISWIFLSISLLSSLIFFPVFKFSPPRKYGALLFVVYIVFVVVAVLSVSGALPILL